MFTTVEGRPLDPRNFTRKFYELVKAAGLERANFHALRHTFATRLLELGKHPKVVQELLGDSQITVVLDTYSHVLPNIKEQAAAHLNDVLLPRYKNEKATYAPPFYCSRNCSKLPVCGRGQSLEALIFLVRQVGFEPTTR
ncbi:MAG: hypothetical protein PWP65_1021 [Clostridia bacterium]|nr:hypothetical protein [Clostridia bacterium]